MRNTVVRTYDNLASAESARRELLRHGFSADSVELRVGLDEAGPVEGNFVENQKDMGTGPGSGVFTPEERTDAYNDDEPVWRGGYLLAVDADGAEQEASAADIMDRFGAIDIEARTGRGGRPH